MANKEELRARLRIPHSRLDDINAVLLDPNPWSADQTTSLAGYTVSPDGRTLAYAVSEAGSDWHREAAPAIFAALPVVAHHYWPDPCGTGRRAWPAASHVRPD